MPEWNAAPYLQFADERAQPSLDLIARLAVPQVVRIADIPCGPGNSTAALRRHWPNAEIVGLDNSPQMIEAARETYPGEKWILGDAATWKTGERFDLVFSNAALQWVPHHETLIPHLFDQVASGGALAVQVPAHYVSGLHRETLSVADDAAWRERMKMAREAMTNHAPGFYYDFLQPLSVRIELWET